MKAAHITVLILVCCSYPLSAYNAIDSLKSFEEIQSFLVRNVSSDWENYPIAAKQAEARPYGKNSFHKVDLDRNGLTDIVVNGVALFAITDNGNGSYSTHGIGSGFVNYTLLDIIKIDSNTVLRVRLYTELSSAFNSYSPDTLILKFGGFMNYNPKPDTFGLDWLYIHTGGCFGNCPMYTLEIDEDWEADYETHYYHKPNISGSAYVMPALRAQLLGALQYAGVFQLKDEYIDDVSCVQPIDLKIKSDDGRKKKIKLEVILNPFSIERIIAILNDVRESHTWK